MVNIGNLPPQFNDDQLRAAFASCGEIEHARVWRALLSGNSTGLAIVRFASSKSAEKALELDKKEISGQPIRVTRAVLLRPIGLDYVPRSLEHEPTRTIFVGRIAHAADESLLKREFERFGKIADIRLSRDRATGNSRGFAYIDFVAPSSVEKAVQFDATLRIDGFSVKIQRDHASRRGKREISGDRVSRRGPDSLSNDGQEQDSWEYDY